MSSLSEKSLLQLSIHQQPESKTVLIPIVLCPEELRTETFPTLLQETEIIYFWYPRVWIYMHFSHGNLTPCDIKEIKVFLLLLLLTPSNVSTILAARLSQK